MEISRAAAGPGRLQNRATRGLESTNRALSRVLERLSTARRINRASDDAAGLSIAERLQTQVRGFRMASRNMSDAMSALNIGEGATNEISALLQRNRELALQARNGTLTDDQRASLDVEFQQNLQEIERISETARFNTQELLSGTGLGSGDALIQAGPNEGEIINLPEMEVGLAGLGLAGSGIATQDASSLALSSIDSSFDVLNTTRSTIGATVNRLESGLRNLAVAEINTVAAEEVLRDMDMAAGIAELTRSRLLQEAGISAFQRFNEISAAHIMSLFQ